MSSPAFPLPKIEHEPKPLPGRSAWFQRQLQPTLSFGEIIFPLRPESIARARMFQNQKANSYSQSALSVNTRVTHKQSNSDKFSPLEFQYNSLPVNTEQKPPNSEVWTAISDWLATSQTFEKPPAPASITDPAPRQRRCKEYWLQISNSLELRIKSHSTHSEAPSHSNAGSVYAIPGVNGTSSTTQPQTTLPQPTKHTASDQLSTVIDTVVAVLPDTMGPPKKQEGDRRSSLEANICEVREKLEKHKREQERQERFEAGKLNRADEAVTATAMHDKQREREEYVQQRAHDIHENLLQCKPFDMEAVRREFSELEVQGIKRIVRELGFAKE